MTRAWRYFKTDGSGTIFEMYCKPIIETTAPYAVVVGVDTDEYRATPADSIDTAMVIADEVFKSARNDPGIRIYLRSGAWCCQVHYAGASPWPTHEECERAVTIDCMENVLNAQAVRIETAGIDQHPF